MGKAGVNPFTIARVLGHRLPGMEITDRYVGVDVRTLLEAVETPIVKEVQ